jgi:hypothetical protein
MGLLDFSFEVVEVVVFVLSQAQAVVIHFFQYHWSSSSSSLARDSFRYIDLRFGLLTPFFFLLLSTTLPALWRRPSNASG